MSLREYIIARKAQGYKYSHRKEPLMCDADGCTHVHYITLTHPAGGIELFSLRGSVGKINKADLKGWFL